MIKTKQDLKYYLESDKIALGIERKFPRILMNQDLIWRFEILLRKCEYYKNNNKNLINKIIYIFHRVRLSNMQIKLGFSIPLNVFGPGLSIAHRGTIVVNGNAKVGRNCRIQEDVNIGSTNGNGYAPQLGDNVFIGTGAKLIGKITIGNNVCIGANAVVTKSFPDNITVGGVPAKKISDNNSHRMLQKLLRESKKFQEEFGEK